MIRIELDPGAGFCFGVDRVIRTAETHLKNGDILFGLGEMVHNSKEVSRLNRLGLKTIRHSELGEVKEGKVLFRAHGEPPATYNLAREKGIEIIDGTCPIVIRLQEKIKAAYDTLDHRTQQLVIFGKANHPETIGLLGQVDQDAIVVSSMADINRIDPSKEVWLFSQTTMDPDQYREVEEAIRTRLHKQKLHSDRELLKSDCTICGQMKKRKPGLKAFARRVDLVLFVSGKNSSNGKMLFEYCATINPDTYWVSGAEEIDPDWFSEVQIVGISGATSTSRDQLQAVAEQVKKLTTA
jgi:4-hydroxy-3-methylbut-2-enyl diphosphate reductase